MVACLTGGSAEVDAAVCGAGGGLGRGCTGLAPLESLNCLLALSVFGALCVNGVSGMKMGVMCRSGGTSEGAAQSTTAAMPESPQSPPGGQDPYQWRPAAARGLIRVGPRL